MCERKELDQLVLSKAEFIMKTIELDIPEYMVDREPDHRAIGKKVDEVLKEHFMTQTVLIRALGSMEHRTSR